MTLTFSYPQHYHDFSDFQCEDPAMDLWLRTKALSWHASRVTSVHLGTLDGAAQVRMFFTLSARSYDVKRMDDYHKKVLDKDLVHVPMILIGKLAVDERFTRQGYGTRCVAQACHEAAKLRAIGAAFVAVEPASNRMTWYQDMGFHRARADLNFVYLPMHDIEATFSTETPIV